MYRSLPQTKRKIHILLFIFFEERICHVKIICTLIRICFCHKRRSVNAFSSHDIISLVKMLYSSQHFSLYPNDGKEARQVRLPSFLSVVLLYYLCPPHHRIPPPLPAYLRLAHNALILRLFQLSSTVTNSLHSRIRWYVSARCRPIMMKIFSPELKILNPR